VGVEDELFVGAGGKRLKGLGGGRGVDVMGGGVSGSVDMQKGGGWSQPIGEEGTSDQEEALLHGRSRGDEFGLGRRRQGGPGALKPPRKKGVANLKPRKVPAPREGERASRVRGKGPEKNVALLYGKGMCETITSWGTSQRVRPSPNGEKEKGDGGGVRGYESRPSTKLVEWTNGKTLNL